MSGENNLNSIFEASYQNPKDAAVTLSNLGYTFDTSLSSPTAKVFVDKEGNPNIAYRGSHRVEDILTDISLGFGYDTKRQKDARETAKAVEAKYKKPATAYGHSLGGALAEGSGVGGKVITFNKAVAAKDVFKTVPKTQTDYRTERDIVSLPSVFQKGGKKVLIESKGDVISAHRLGAFSGKKKTIKSGNPLASFF
jgi:hypothetical protein